MAYASQSGRATTDPSSPRAFAVCDRCGIWHNRDHLKFQYDWRGTALANIQLLVCSDCYDTPQEQLRAIIVPADPMPILNPRVESFDQDETDYRTISAPTVYDPTTGIPIPSSTRMLTEDGDFITLQPIGVPDDIDPNAIPPLKGTVHYGTVLPALSVTSIGTDVIIVICSNAHGLSDNDQISVVGLSNAEANGTYSVTFITTTAFTYQAGRAITAGALLTGGTRIVTLSVGLPRGYTQVPQTGV